jgi:hypothetical protein
MKDSFASFKDADITSWRINVRGSHAQLAKDFLEENISQKAQISCTESGKGWFYDTSKMIDDIGDGYVLYWIEDHINTKCVEELNSIFKEIVRSQIDQIQYSFFSRAKYEACDDISSGENKHFRVVDFSNKSWKQFLSRCGNQNVTNPYLISLASIMSTQCFKSVINKRDPLLRRHSKHTPFDFEKNHKDLHWLPLKTGFLNSELFANIDTDHDGLSLISRGLYNDCADIKVQGSIELESVSKLEKWCISVLEKVKIIIPKSLLRFMKRITFFYS